MHASDQRLLLCGVMRGASKKLPLLASPTARLSISVLIGDYKGDVFATIYENGDCFLPLGSIVIYS